MKNKIGSKIKLLFRCGAFDKIGTSIRIMAGDRKTNRTWHRLRAPLGTLVEFSVKDQLMVRVWDRNGEYLVV